MIPIERARFVGITVVPVPWFTVRLRRTSNRHSCLRLSIVLYLGFFFLLRLQISFPIFGNDTRVSVTRDGTEPMDCRYRNRWALWSFSKILQASSLSVNRWHAGAASHFTWCSLGGSSEGTGTGQRTLNI